MRQTASLPFLVALIVGCTTSVESPNPEGVEQVDKDTYRVTMITSGVPIPGHASSEARSVATSYCKKRNQEMIVKHLDERNAPSFIPGREAELTFECANARGIH
jgi:hypothetical protein